MVTNRDIANIQADIDAINGTERGRLRAQRDREARALELAEQSLAIAREALNEDRRQSSLAILACSVSGVSFVLAAVTFGLSLAHVI